MTKPCCVTMRYFRRAALKTVAAGIPLGVLMLSACAEPARQPPETIGIIKAEELSASWCATPFADLGATLTVDSTTCGDCFLENPELAIDGDPNTYARFLLGAGIENTITIRVAGESGAVAPSTYVGADGASHAVWWSNAFGLPNSSFKRMSFNATLFRNGQPVRSFAGETENDDTYGLPFSGFAGRAFGTIANVPGDFDAAELSLTLENFAGGEFLIREICPDQRAEFANDPYVSNSGTAQADSRAETGVAVQRRSNWGDPESKSLRPGNYIVTDGAGCTTSFIFTDGHGRYFVSTAAHCVADGSSTDTDGCTAPTNPIGTTVSTMYLDDPNAPNTLLLNKTVGLPLAYSSWNTMQTIGETSSAACRGNDFALLEVPREHLDILHPASLHFRAPTGMAPLQDPVDASGETIWGFGASDLKAGVRELYPKQGVILNVTNEGWTYEVYLGSPGIPGDSGGHIMTDDGRALGVASTILLAPYPAANHYGNIAMATDYARKHAGLNLQLVTWDDFNPSLNPVGAAR